MTMKKAIGDGLLGLVGWKTEGEIPTAPKYVLIAAPHTSNWDFPFTVATAFSMEVPIRWLGKRELFDGPLGPLYRALGGIAVERSKSTNMVERMAALFDEHESLVLTVPAEGTRSKGEFWKSGFYRIAETAKVPIALGFLDFGRKRSGIGPLVMPSGDVRADMDKIRAFYASIRGLKHQNFTEPRLREETEGDSEV